MNSNFRFIDSYKLKEIFVASYIVFNFINRDMSNFFLIAVLILCIVDYENLIGNLRNNKDIVLVVVAFSLWVSIVGYFHSTPLHEMDNYYRFLMLLPLLSINFRKR